MPAHRAPSEQLQSMVLVLFGAVLLHLACSPELVRYVRPSTRPMVVTGAVVIMAAGTYRVARALWSGSGSGSGSGVAPGARGTRAVWLMLAPALLMGLAGPPALGPAAVATGELNAARPSSGFARLPRTDPVSITISQLVLRTVWENDRGLGGRQVRVTGFVQHRARTGFLLARFVITCCAADARPYAVSVRFAGRPPPTGRWVRVTGRLLGRSSPGLVPAMTAQQVSFVAPPADPYE